MKRKTLDAAVAAGLVAAVGMAGSVNAVELSPDGLGQVLIYPYYTVNRNQQTILSVVNATNAAKAVKVRFLEGYNAREVLDFNLFLSEYDVWTASVFALADVGLPGDGAALLTTDRSCTAPNKSAWTGQLGGNPYQVFLEYAYTGARQDSGPVDKSRTREGYVELIQMADLAGSLRTAVTHTAGGVPANCAVVQAIDPSSTALLAPSGGLFGTGGIVNVAQGTFYSYNADAIGGFTQFTLFSDTGEFITLARANTGPGVATARVSDASGESFRSDFSAVGAPSQAIDAVSAVFMASSLLNEYNVDASAGSMTDWVVTFPTKQFYTDPDILGLDLGDAGALPPFTYTFGQRAAGNGDGKSCSQVELLHYDREEGRPVPAIGFPEAPPPVIPVLCTSVNVISLILRRDVPATESAVLGSRLFMRVPAFAPAGWLRLNLNPASQPHLLRASLDGDVYAGLPATGFEAVNYVNANVMPGGLSNYSATFRHRALRKCVNAAAGSWL